MSRKDWKNIFILLGSLSEKHKDVLISLVGLSVFTAVRPFITVVLTGMLVDAVYAGVDSGLLLRYVAVGVTGTFLMQAAEGVLVMFFNRKLEYMQEIQGQPLNRKSMAMDYEYLENVDVHETPRRGVSLISFTSDSALLLLENYLHYRSLIFHVKGIGLIFPYLYTFDSALIDIPDAFHPYTVDNEGHILFIAIQLHSYHPSAAICSN